MAVTTSVHQEQVKAEKPVRTCSYCGEPSGSISKGTGRPLMFWKDEGSWAHVNCRPMVSLEMLDRIAPLESSACVPLRGVMMVMGAGAEAGERGGEA